MGHQTFLRWVRLVKCFDDCSIMNIEQSSSANKKSDKGTFHVMNSDMELFSLKKFKIEQKNTKQKSTLQQYPDSESSNAKDYPTKKRSRQVEGAVNCFQWIGILIKWSFNFPGCNTTFENCVVFFLLVGLCDRFKI